MNNKYQQTNKLFFLCFTTLLSGNINTFAMDSTEEPNFDPVRNMYHFGNSLDKLEINQKAVAPLINDKENGVVYSLVATADERAQHDKDYSSINNQRESILTGEDRRDQVDTPNKQPWCTRGQLIMTYLDDKTKKLTRYMGSGTLIGDKYVLTAAHNIYDHKTESIPESITFFNGRKGSKYDNKANALRIAITHEYHSATDDHIRKNSDIGLIELETSITNANPFPRVHVFDNTDLENKDVTVAGYPGLNYMFTMDGPVAKTSVERLFYDVDTEPGQSGSGIYITREGSEYIVGVHAYGTNRENGADSKSDDYKYNSGTRINAQKEKLINSWKTYFSTNPIQ